VAEQQHNEQTGREKDDVHFDGDRGAEGHAAQAPGAQDEAEKGGVEEEHGDRIVE